MKRKRDNQRGQVKGKEKKWNKKKIKCWFISCTDDQRGALVEVPCCDLQNTDKVSVSKREKER